MKYSEVKAILKKAHALGLVKIKRMPLYQIQRKSGKVAYRQYVSSEELLLAHDIKMLMQHTVDEYRYLRNRTPLRVRKAKANARL